ncbi:hypothetical protein [Paraburkholderia sp. GAS32]|jgi:hypothetical protein|uniref:hypothetical protein n=1 Tax=Paraburkholderia sp. GAS32 TaxID=3035129 RepID=UPI003D1B4069
MGDVAALEMAYHTAELKRLLAQRSELRDDGDGLFSKLRVQLTMRIEDVKKQLKDVSLEVERESHCGDDPY